MGIPLSTPVVRKDRSYRTDAEDTSARKSVFEEELDSTVELDGVFGNEDTRWKFKGPWLAGQTEGDFNAYVATEVRKRKGEFQQFLRTACAKSMTAEARRMAPEEMPAAVEASDLTQEQMTLYIKKLRDNTAELFRLIRAFLDLPPAPSRNAQDVMEDWITELATKGKTKSRTKQASDFPVSTSPYADSGPPKTHPSAGLAYSRTSARFFNHPVWGPQRSSPPVQARVVMPKGAATGNFAPVLGVGGFVTAVPTGSGYDSFNVQGSSGKPNKPARAPLVPGLLQVEPDKVGGSKTYVHPVHARVDPKGRVLLSVVPGDGEAIAVLEETTHKIPRPETTSTPVGLRGYARSTGIASQVKNAATGGGGGYGLSYKAVPPRPATPAAPRRDAMSDVSSILGRAE